MPALIPAARVNLAAMCSNQLHKEKELASIAWPRSDEKYIIKFFTSLVVEHIDCGFVGRICGWDVRRDSTDQ